MIHDCDRGQYVSIRYSKRLAEAAIEPSIGSKGDSYDNALAKTINGLYKGDLVHRQALWRSKEAAELAALEWSSWLIVTDCLSPSGTVLPPKLRQTATAVKPSGQ